MPVSTLESLRAAYAEEASGVVVGRRHGLAAIGGFRHYSGVTDDEGTFAVHVFARVTDGVEEHVLLLWPVAG